MHKKSPPRVQLYILSRDRPYFFKQSLASAIKQTCDQFEIIVSDNSESDEISQWMAIEHPNIKYIRRTPTLPALLHFKTLIEECDAEFTVLFHDDDTLNPIYIKSMLEHMDKNTNISAIGCNANYILNETPSKQTLIQKNKAPNIIKNTSELLNYYFALSMYAAPPFPGYMYRTKFIKGLFLDTDTGGKHADVSFLAALQSLAPILIVSDILMNYRLHSSNDSQIEDIAARLKLLRHLANTYSINKKNIAIQDYRFSYWLRYYKNKKKLNQNLKNSVVRKFLFFNAIKIALTRKILWEKLLFKITNKCKNAT